MPHTPRAPCTTWCSHCRVACAVLPRTACRVLHCCRVMRVNDDAEHGGELSLSHRNNAHAKRFIGTRLFSQREHVLMLSSISKALSSSAAAPLSIRSTLTTVSPRITLQSHNNTTHIHKASQRGGARNSSSYTSVYHTTKSTSLARLPPNPVTSSRSSSLSSSPFSSTSPFSTAAKSKRPPRVFKNRDPIVVTDAACVRIRELTKGKEDVLGIRLGVRRRGCNGLR